VNAAVCDTCGGTGLITIGRGKLMCPDCQPDPRVRETLGIARRVFAEAAGASTDDETGSTKPKT